MGDITLIDRSESVIEQKRNKDLFESTQTKEFDFNGTWQNSLRNNEPDLARNGLDLIKLEGLRKKA